MNCNSGILLRINKAIRNTIIIPRMRRMLKKSGGGYTIFASNCMAGFVYHDLGLEFKSPTINLWFRGEDFLDFVEDYKYYINAPLIQTSLYSRPEGDPEYPIGILQGNENHRDLVLHFNHYHSFEEAWNAWNRRKARVDINKVYVIHSFGNYKREKTYYDRWQSVPIKHKVIFVNHPVDKKYKDFFYIKGFEENDGLGNIMSYMRLDGKKYCDQFDFVKWLNED